MAPPLLARSKKVSTSVGLDIEEEESIPKENDQLESIAKEGLFSRRRRA